MQATHLICRTIDLFRRRGYGVDCLRSDAELIVRTGPRAMRYLLASEQQPGTSAGFAVVAVERAEGHEKPLHDRPGWRQLMVQVRSGDAVNVSLAALGAIWRRGYDRGLARAIAKGAEVRIDIGGKAIILRAPIDQKALKRLRAVATAARATFHSQRTIQAMRRLRDAGGRVTRRPPLGMKFVDGRAVPDLQERATMRKVLELRNLRFSYLVIAKQLNRDGVPSRDGKPWNKLRVWRLARVGLTLETAAEHEGKA